MGYSLRISHPPRLPTLTPNPTRHLREKLLNKLKLKKEAAKKRKKDIKDGVKKMEKRKKTISNLS